MKKFMLIILILFMEIASCTKKDDQLYLIASSPVFESQLPTSDGVVLLAIENVDPRCLDNNEPINLKFVFNNLTANSIVLANHFIIDPNEKFRYDLTAYIRDSSGTQFVISSHVPRGDPFEVRSDEFIDLSGNMSIDTILPYYFSELIITFYDSSENDSDAPGSEYYYLRFVYENSDPRQASWIGIISSNEVEICLVH